MRPALLAAVAAAALVLAGATHASTELRPRLAFVSDAPVVVAGRGFRANERVRLLVTAPELRVRTVRAGELGRFRVAFSFRMPRCGGVVVQAFGNRGSRAMIDRAGPDCAPID